MPLWVMSSFLKIENISDYIYYWVKEFILYTYNHLIRYILFSKDREFIVRVNVYLKWILLTYMGFRCLIMMFILFRLVLVVIHTCLVILFY